MTLEAAAVIGAQDEVLHWHLPAGRTPVHLPDSRRLWEILWAHRAELAGVAHTHPGNGAPTPSTEDLTTFRACEAGLGRRLRWWIATADAIACYAWSGPGPFDYTLTEPGPTPWLDTLRRHAAGGDP